MYTLWYCFCKKPVLCSMVSFRGLLHSLFVSSGLSVFVPVLLIMDRVIGIYKIKLNLTKLNKCINATSSTLLTYCFQPPRLLKILSNRETHEDSKQLKISKITSNLLIRASASHHIASCNHGIVAATTFVKQPRDS